MLKSLFDNFPEGVVQVGQGRILYFNPMAAYYLPQLEVGAPVPGGLDLPVSAPSVAGTFSSGLTTYTFSLAAQDLTEGYTIFFRPAPQTALTQQQLEGALRQLRSFLGEFAAELGPCTAPGAQPPSRAALADFIKSYYRAFRLVNNLEYMRQASSPEGLPFRATTMDLAGLCRQMVQAAAELLAQAGTVLEFDSDLPSLLIPGDPQLLRTLLLGLISNSAQAAQGGTISLRLRRQSSRALLILSDTGEALTQRQLAALLQQDIGQAIPLPGQGAGLGLSIARHIVSLHQGSLLVEWGQSAPTTLISLPTGPLDGRVSVESPRYSQDGGLDPLLVELSDVLPAEVFGLDGLD